MFGTIRKHQNWLWYIIIAFIVVSFVVYFSPYSKVHDTNTKTDFGKINGKEITRAQWNTAFRETHLFHYLRYQSWPGASEAARQSGFDVEREAYNRLFLIEKMAELNLQVSPEAAAKWITQVLGSSDDKPFDVRLYDLFVTERLKPHGITSADFEQFAAHEVARQHLIAVHGQSGRLVPPQEAEFLYRRENQPLDTEIVLVEATNYLSKVQVTPAVLAQFYTNNQAAYFLPERIQVQFIKYDTTNFLAQAATALDKITNLTASLDQIYQRRGGTNFYVGLDGKPLSLDAARVQIKDQFRQEGAELAGKKEAAKFINALFDLREKQPGLTNALEKLAADRGFKVGLTAPFDLRTGPSELSVPSAFAQAAFSLTTEDPYAASPLTGTDGIYVIGLKKRIARELQPLEAVRVKLTEDYKQAEALKAMRVEGERLQVAITNGLAQGKSFDAVCTAAGVKPMKLSPFSQATRTMPELEGKVSFGFVQNVAEGLEVGKASNFRALSESGFIVYLRARLPVDDAKMKTDMPEFLNRIREQRQMAAFAEWFQTESQQLQRPVVNRDVSAKR